MINQMDLGVVSRVEQAEAGVAGPLADAMEEIFLTIYRQEVWAAREDAIDLQIRYGLGRR